MHGEIERQADLIRAYKMGAENVVTVPGGVVFDGGKVPLPNNYTMSVMADSEGRLVFSLVPRDDLSLIKYSGLGGWRDISLKNWNFVGPSFPSDKEVPTIDAKKVVTWQIQDVTDGTIKIHGSVFVQLFSPSNGSTNVRPLLDDSRGQGSLRPTHYQCLDDGFEWWQPSDYQRLADGTIGLVFNPDTTTSNPPGIYSSADIESYKVGTND